MRRAAVILQRIQAEVAARADGLDDPSLSAVTIVVKLDRTTGLPGAILWRPEYERRLNGKPLANGGDTP